MSFALDAYAARSCAVKTQNAFHPGVTLPVGTPDESLADQFLGGGRFEDEVIAEMLGGFEGTVADLRPLLNKERAAQVVACADAMSSGVDLIIAGALPVDLEGHRRGRPDLWVRGPDAAGGGPGYYPLEIKFHRVLEQRPTGARTLPLSPVTRPRREGAAPVGDVAFRMGGRSGDLLQVAHYWRLLEASGRAADGGAAAGLIGTDDTTVNGERAVVWMDLDEPMFNSHHLVGIDLPSGSLSALERYDQHHAFLVRVALNALAQKGSPDDPALLAPIVRRECLRCPWWAHCRPLLDDDDLSLRIDKSPLDIVEIRVLRDQGIATVAELANTDLEPLLPRYLPMVTHRPGAEERLRLAAHRAQLMAAGVELERIGTAPIELPAAEIEIDLDIETSADDRVYLWGFLLHGPDGLTGYRGFARFDRLDADAEVALAAEALAWLHELCRSASVKVFHYSDYETIRLRRLAAASDHPEIAWAAQWASEGFVDLFELVRRHFFGVRGLGLKAVARASSGFRWRDKEPGGLNSLRWHAEAVGAGDAETRERARARILDYNEDDVRATWEVRRWLRGLNATSPASWPPRPSIDQGDD